MRKNGRMCLWWTRFVMGFLVSLLKYDNLSEWIKENSIDENSFIRELQGKKKG